MKKATILRTLKEMLLHFSFNTPINEAIRGCIVYIQRLKEDFIRNHHLALGHKTNKLDTFQLRIIRRIFAHPALIVAPCK